MNLLKFSFARLSVLLLIGTSLVQSALPAQDATQTVTLVEGWNAVWLEVAPVYPDSHPTDAGRAMAPEDAFETTLNPSIAAITSPRPLSGLSELFGESPSAVSGSFNQSGWEQWYRNPADPDFVNDLVGTTGNRAYLILVDAGTATFSLSITGQARFYRPSWVPDRYNLIGFGIDGTLSFQDFFAPSAGIHPVGQIYSLNAAGNWSVVNPSDAIVNDTAYWIYARGPSRYMGPVAVDFDLATRGELSFGSSLDAIQVGVAPDDKILDLEELVLTNLMQTGADAVPRLDLITPAAGSGELALHVVRPITGSLAYELGNTVDSTEGDGLSAPLDESVAPQSTSVLSIGAQRNWSSGAVGRTNLYRLYTGGGNAVWLPVSASQGNLQNPADLLPASATDSVAGLWVGEVIVDGVTSIVENGAPVRPTAGVAPLRLILHSNADGVVSLLSQVTVMQTKTADSSVEPESVLVVDPAQIPYFEGIRKREGKQVGLRIESVAIDMPRNLDPAMQSALVAKAAAAVPPVNLASESDILNYLVGSNLRPSTLEEVYHFTLVLDGALGTGKTVRTRTDAPLVLDPFHRSNPFRHVYHHQHARGSNITRAIEIVFDAEQPMADRLSGTFRESLEGVTKSTLELSGRVELQRVSPVSHFGIQ